MDLHTSQNSKGERLGRRASGDHGSAVDTPGIAGIGSELILFTNTKMRCTVNPSHPAGHVRGGGRVRKMARWRADPTSASLVSDM